MIRYESDEKAVARVLAEREKGALIDDGTARTIASWFNDGADTAIYSLVSTGAIHDGDAGALYVALMRGTTLDDDTRAAAYALNSYLNDRAEYGIVEPVPGWSDMWVPKHVDYPHEDGALDTCWCWDGNDDDDESDA